MRWAPDPAGRFPRRPYYDAAEMDHECETLVVRFLEARHGSTSYPIGTDDLAVLVEQQAADLDLYADLSAEGVGVEAVTEFVPGQRPRVRLAASLSEQPRSAHRLRTTLTHELAHVVFHNFLWWFDDAPAGQAASSLALSPRCHRRTLLGVATDWMEWQAGYACGALLMPTTAVQATVGAPPVKTPRQLAPGQSRRSAAALVTRVASTFDVSREAARLRLTRLGYLDTDPVRHAPRPRT